MATPAPTPVPTPTRRATLVLDAPSDTSRYSPQLATLNVGASMDVDFTPVSVNNLSGERFGHSIEFWLFADASSPIDLEQRGELDSALSFVWNSRDGDWVVSSNTNATGYVYSSRRIRLPFGSRQTMRVRRTTTGFAEFFLGGDLVMELVNPAASKRVYVRTYATTAEFSYLPGAFGSSAADSPVFGPPPSSNPGHPWALGGRAYIP